MTQGNCLPVQWTWKDRLRARIFPFVPCDLPQAPASFKDVIVTKVKSDLSVVDRIKVLITGKIEIETRVVTENMVGEHRTAAVVRAGRFF